MFTLNNRNELISCKLVPRAFAIEIGRGGKRPGNEVEFQVADTQRIST